MVCCRIIIAGQPPHTTPLTFSISAFNRANAAEGEISNHGEQRALWEELDLLFLTGTGPLVTPNLSQENLS